MKDAADTPATQLRLADEKITGEERFNPTRNLADDLTMTTPAQKRHIHLDNPKAAEKSRNGNEDDEDREMSNHFLRRSPEDATGPETKAEHREIVAQTESLKVSDKDYRMEIENLKQIKQQDVSKNMEIKKVDDLEVTVQEKLNAIMEGTDAIRYAAKKTTVLMTKVDGAVL